MPEDEGDLFDLGESASVTGQADFGDATLELETLQRLSANEAIRELIFPIIDDMLSSIAFEIADLEFFISTGPLGELETLVADDTGLTDEIDTEWESL